MAEPRQMDGRICDGVHGCLRDGRRIRTRGLCNSCYEQARRLVKDGSTTWEDLEAHDKALPRTIERIAGFTEWALSRDNEVVEMPISSIAWSKMPRYIKIFRPFKYRL